MSDSEFQVMILDHVKKVEGHMVQARDARAEQEKSINCLRENFTAFQDEYGPMLKDATKRRKWWEERTEEVQKRTVLAAGWVLVLALVYGLGHAVIFLLKKVNVFLGN